MDESDLDLNDDSSDSSDNNQEALYNSQSMFGINHGITKSDLQEQN